MASMLAAFMRGWWRARPTGARLACLRLHGLISQSTGNSLRDARVLSFDRVRPWADAAFACKPTAVVLSINCPGGVKVWG